jgi:hypothetical protein
MGIWASNPRFSTVKVGVGSDYFEIQKDGNVKLNGEASSWNDIKFPLQGQNLTTVAGRIDYNFDDCSVDFSDTARYPQEPICFLAQMDHSKLLGSMIELHLHWLQNSENTPNWVIGYRWINTGEAGISVSNEVLLPHIGNIITYTSGTISQLTEFGSIVKTVPDTLSSILQIRLFRDSANATTEFDGADPYVGIAQALEFDIHYIKDGFGSNDEYIK